MVEAHDPLVSAVDALAAAAHTLAECQADSVLARFPSYVTAAVPRLSLVASGLRNVHQLVSILRSGVPPGSGELDEARRARERTAQGVPADDLYDAYRMCLRLLGEAFVEHAARYDVPAEQQIASVRLLWESADRLTSAVVVARLAAELELARHDEGRRLDVLRALLFGDGALSLRRQRLSALGMPVDRSYFVVRARTASAAARESLRGRFETGLRTYGCRPLFGIVDGDVTGIAPLRPLAEERDYVAGVVGPVSLDEMPDAFASASRLLDVAQRFGISGASDLSTLRLKVAVLGEPELGELLDGRLLQPLREAGDFGVQLRETLDAWLGADCRIAETSLALGLHQNTVRHRLERYAMLVDVDLERLETRFELWWVLQRARSQA